MPKHQARCVLLLRSPSFGVHELTLSFASRLLKGITTKYRAAVQAMVNSEGRRLIVNIDDVRQFDPTFAEGYVVISVFGNMLHRGEDMAERVRAS